MKFEFLLALLACCLIFFAYSMDEERKACKLRPKTADPRRGRTPNCISLLNLAAAQAAAADEANQATLETQRTVVPSSPTDSTAASNEDGRRAPPCSPVVQAAQQASSTNFPVLNLNREQENRTQAEVKTLDFSQALLIKYMKCLKQLYGFADLGLFAKKSQ